MRFFWKKPVDPAVFFLHIPKCAGTTLTEEIIKKKFKPDELIIFYEYGTDVLINRLKDMGKQEQKKIKCIAGHFAFGIHNYYNARPVTYVTVLRDPIERVISHYYDVLHRKAHYLHKTVKDNNLTLKDYVSNKLSLELNNGQTRILAGIGWGADFGECTEAMFEQAMKNIDSSGVVGVSEKFEQFIELVEKKLVWNIPKFKSRNIGKNRLRKEDIDEDTLSVIRHYNSLDIKLYRHACTLFQNQYDKYCR